MSYRTVEGCSYTCLHRFNDVHVYHAGNAIESCWPCHYTRGIDGGRGGGGGLDEPLNAGVQLTLADHARYRWGGGGGEGFGRGV